MLIDADPQGSLTVSLGIKRPDELGSTLANVMQSIVEDKELSLDFGILRTEDGMDLMPANIELSGIKVRLVNEMSRERVLKSYVDTVRDKYEYILIDCMPSLGMMTFNALCAADSVIIPTQPEFLSAKGLEQLLSTISRVKRHINPDLKVDGILITMVDNRTRLGKSLINVIRRDYGKYRLEFGFINGTNGEKVTDTSLLGNIVYQSSILTTPSMGKLTFGKGEWFDEKAVIRITYHTYADKNDK